MKERLPYIDIAKGLLMICVILGHITGIGIEFGGVQNNYFEHLGYLLSTFYAPFYMQAFFLITGYTSNFDKPFTLFLSQNSKKLLLPYVFWGILYAVFNKVCFHHDLFFTTLDGESLFFLVEYYWFLSSLFIAKILYWFINKLHNKVLIIAVSVALFLLGNIICVHYKEAMGTAHWNNWFHYRNALMMILFISLGQLIKKRPIKVMGLTGTILYVSLFLMSILIGIHLPNNGHAALLQIKEIPLHIACATAGSLMILFISRFFLPLGNKFLELFGKNSLAIYLTHYFILEIVLFFLGKLWAPIGMFQGSAMYLVSVAIVLPCCLFISQLMKRKPFSYTLGEI